MADVKDPIRDALISELRAYRKGAGFPGAERFTNLYYLTEILGDGILERAFAEMTRLYDEHGDDPRSAIGAYFYLAGWTIGLDTVDDRRNLYAVTYRCDISTALRRSERGIRELSTLIRDQDESHRPWAFISIFQSGNTFQPFLDFNLGYESWQTPVVHLNGEPLKIDFRVHRDPETEHRVTSRIILPESPLKLNVAFGEQMAVLRVLWPMPVWPVWNLVSWTADPRILTRMRTFRRRAVEVSIEWWRKTPPGQVEGLVGDGAIWAERRDPNNLNLPTGWRMR